LGLAVCVCLYILISSIPKVEIKVARKPRTSAIVFDVKNISDKSYDVYRIYYDGYNIDGSHIYHGDLGCAGKLDSGESGEWTDVFWIHDVPDTVKIIKVKARILGNVDESEIPFKQIN